MMQHETDDSPILVRTAEEILERALSSDGAPPLMSVVEIAAERWSGKTALLEDFTRKTAARGWSVASAAAQPGGPVMPFGLLVNALEDLVEHLDTDRVEGRGVDHVARLAALFPALAAAAPDAVTAGAEPFQLYRAMRALLRTLAGDGGLVLALDDVQWADEASLQLLGHLLEHPVDAPFVLVLAHRGRSADRTLNGLIARCADRGGLLRVRPAGLTEEEAISLLPAELSRVQCETLLHESGRSPGLLRAFARLGQVPGVAGWTQPLPASLLAKVLGEFRALSAEAWQVVRAAAVLSEPFDPEDLKEVARVDGTVLWCALDKLVHEELLCPGELPWQWRFCNPLLRVAAYQSAGPGWLLGAHATAAELLSRRLDESAEHSRAAEPAPGTDPAQAGAPDGHVLPPGPDGLGGFPLAGAPEPYPALPGTDFTGPVAGRAPVSAPRHEHTELARHLERSAAIRDQSSARVLLDAAARQLWVDPAQAVSWIRTATSFRGSVPMAPRERLLLGQALLLAGRPAESLTALGPLCDAARAPSDDGLRAEAVYRRAQAHRLLGRPDQAEAEIAAALEEWGTDASGPADMLRHARFEQDLWAGRTPRSVDGASPPVPATASRALRGRLLAQVAAAAARSARTPDAERRAGAARQPLRSAPDAELAEELEGLYWLGTAESVLGRPAAACALYERGLRIAESRRLASLVPLFALALGALQLNLGDLTGAARHAACAEAGAAAVGSEDLLSRALQLKEQTAGAADGGAGPTGPPGGPGRDPEEPAGSLDELSRRESEVAVLVSAGRTNQQIARVLELSHKTVETYLGRIFQKLQVQSRAEVAAMVGRSDRLAVAAEIHQKGPGAGLSGSRPGLVGRTPDTTDAAGWARLGAVRTRAPRAPAALPHQYTGSRRNA